MLSAFENLNQILDINETKFKPYHDPRNGQFTFAPSHSASGHYTSGPKRPHGVGKINDLGGRLYAQVNRPAYENLYDGLPVEGISNSIRGQALDYAMVHKEKTFVQDYLNHISPTDREAFTKDVTSTLVTFGTKTQRKVISKIGVDKFDFGKQAHREAIGYDAVDRARLKNTKR